MKTRSWLAVAVAGGVAAVGVAGSGVSARSPQSADVVELSLLDNSINRAARTKPPRRGSRDVAIPAFEEEMAAAGTPVEVSFEGQGVDDEPYKSTTRARPRLR